MCVCFYRYPYYALSVLDMEAKMLTWLRYTVWIPLYPLGFTCEGTQFFCFTCSGKVCLFAFKSFESDVFVCCLFSFCIATVLWLSIAHFEEAGDYQLDLPNPYNMSFNIVALLWISICSVPFSKSARACALC